MATGNFDKCLTRTLVHEGGWSNHPKDPGGATMRGVIQRVYDGYRDRKGLGRRSVRQITDDELKEIYRRRAENEAETKVIKNSVLKQRNENND